MRMRGFGPAVRLSAASAWLGLFALVVTACSADKPSDPFAPPGGSGGGAGQGGSFGGGGSPLRPPLGEPCASDSDCDDRTECTDDVCDVELGHCRFSPVHDRCDDGIYCNGIEQCESGVGCRPGEPVACSDNTTCTIDRCVEETRSCEHRLRDADGDGDPVWNCGGTDCDDTNPRVNGKIDEICGNGVDDNCDGVIDESDCVTPEYDTCSDPFLVEQSGSYTLSLVAAAEDYALSCVESGKTRRDVVVALAVPEGPPIDIDVWASAPRSAIALATSTQCGDPDSELGCNPSVEVPRRGNVARLVLRDLEPGYHPLYVTGTDDDTVSLVVSYGTALPRPENETCGTALPIEPGKRVETSLASAAFDLETQCASPLGEVVFRFDLTETHDVELRAAPLDDWGEATLSLRDERCMPIDAELACRVGAPISLFARALSAGTYFVAVGSTLGSDVDVRLELSAPSAAPDDEGCREPPELIPGETVSQELFRRVDAVSSKCLPGGVETTRSLTLSEPSDVLLVERISAGDTGAVNLLPADCKPEASLACTRGHESPVRARADALPPGEYRVVAESQLGSPITLTAFVRRAAPSVLVGLSDDCKDATRIPESGGRFIGNTNLAFGDFEASCDFGGGSPGGAPDQILRFELTEPRRVVFDMAGSSYETLLVVRKATACPGPEVRGACVPGQPISKSFLDVVLPAGAYWVQIDGYDGASGTWVLDVFVSEP